MNILFISPSSPRESIGGIERYIINLIDYCKKQPDLKIKMMMPSFGEEYVESDGNVEMIFCRDLAVTKGMAARKTTLMARSFSNTVSGIIIKDKIDIICAENFHLGFPPAFPILLNVIAALYKVPLVLRLHSFATTDIQKELINQLIWRKISCVSISVAGDCFTKGADVDTLSTHYLGVNMAEFNEISTPSVPIREKLNLKPEDKIILTASRIINEEHNILAEKGIINLIESFSKISPRYPNLKLLIAVGRPPESYSNEFEIALKMLDGYIQLRNITDKTTVQVFDMDEMPQVYRESDIFVLTSQNETFGQVFIESMACGLPVIGTKVGGIPEIISDNYNGYLIPLDDASILAQKIENILNDDELRNQFIEAGKRTVAEKFTLEKQFSAFIEMMREIVDTPIQDDSLHKVNFPVFTSVS